MNSMLDCIHDQARVGRMILAEEVSTFHAVDRVLAGRDVSRILILATGSSMNAVRAAQRHLEVVAGAAIVTVEPFTYTAYPNADDQFDLVIAVSQRGTSSSTIDAITAARERVDAPVVAVTADTASPLAGLVDAAIDVRCGDEAIRYSTTGVTATILTMLLFSVRLAERAGRAVGAGLGRSGLSDAIESIDDVIQRAEAYYARAADELDVARRITVLAYGPNIGTAAEAETKIIETVRVPVQGMELEAYMHGPLFELHRDYTLFLTEVPGVPSAERSRQFAEFASRYCDFVHIVTLGESTAWPRELALDLNVAEEVSPVVLVVAYQILAYRMAVARGIDLVTPVFPDFRSAMRTKVAD